MTASGPLQGVRVLEFAGLGPTPFACMLLSDLGAQVLRISRANDAWNQRMGAVLDRGRTTLSLDIKHPLDLEVSRSLAARADVLIEGFRPGVMERLRLGPVELLDDNPKLIYGRMTGWGQSGPRVRDAGHDINYISLSGALHAIGESGKPVPPLNLVALLRARATGKGQVVDCAMTDGAASLMSMAFGLQSHGDWTDQRGNNLLDGGAPF
jgi:alpha-methylacyl-CoA racemase